jgi:hypothetical protein
MPQYCNKPEVPYLSDSRLGQGIIGVWHWNLGRFWKYWQFWPIREILTQC